MGRQKKRKQLFMYNKMYMFFYTRRKFAVYYKNIQCVFFLRGGEDLFNVLACVQYTCMFPVVYSKFVQSCTSVWNKSLL